MQRECWEFLPDHAGKGSLLSSKRQKRGSSGCGWDSRASCGVETGMSGNFLSCSNGVKDPLEVRRLGLISLETPQHEWASSRLEGRTSWIFLSAFLSHRCRGLRPCVESVPEPEDSSPMLTWIWGTSGVSQGSQSSSQIGACTCDFLSSCSSSVTLPFAWIKGSVAFPRGFPTRLYHESFPQGCPSCHLGVSRSSA